MNKKDSHERDCLESEIQMIAVFLNSTPCELQKPLAFGRYAPILCLWHKAHGATLLASLMSELIDSASLRYLRRIRYASRARGGKSLSLQKAEKDSHVCDCLFLAEQERFELSRRYSRPTPLAGAPLHHLSTTPNQLYKIFVTNRRFSVVCHSIIASFLLFVKCFFRFG